MKKEVKLDIMCEKRRCRGNADIEVSKKCVEELDKN